MYVAAIPCQLSAESRITARPIGSDAVSVDSLCRAQDAVGGNGLSAAENAADGAQGLEGSSAGHFCAMVMICKLCRAL